ncbi:MAG TPA: acetyl ornithine aminotransferase family protein [Syntrophobacteraceae bacterium]|nr:acetyl ornithine aminotransferase family protein [Syntrophobacteraceae bacterium]
MKAPLIRTPLPGPKASEFIRRDAECVSPSYTRIYPLVVEKARGLWVQDVDGNEFLDFTAGIAVNATGHCHPQVVEAIRDQAGKLIHMSGTDFYYSPQIVLAEKLAEISHMTGGARVFYGNSGAEAVEAALKLARYHTRREQMISFFGAFHGRTMGALSLSASKAFHRKYYHPFVPGITHVPYPNCYRCPYGVCYPTCGSACVRWIDDMLFRTSIPAEEVAAIFVEPIQGEGGYIVPPPEFHVELGRLAKKFGILLVADEIQSGMGRTGKMFAMEHFGVEPDMMAIAKGIASGMPLGAMVANAKLMDWSAGSHASTFGGNPISCRAALATIDLLQKGLIENARLRGRQLMAGLGEMQKGFECMGDVRGKGLMVAVELVKDRITKENAPELRNLIVQGAFHRGLLLLGCGESAIRFCPALTVSEEEIDTGLSIFEETLKKIS